MLAEDGDGKLQAEVRESMGFWVLRLILTHGVVWACVFWFEATLSGVGFKGSQKGKLACGSKSRFRHIPK